MRIANFGIRISNANDIGTPSNNFGYADGSFLWLLKADDMMTGWKSGILTQEWCTGFSKSVDPRRNGKITSIGGGSVKVNNISGFSTWLANNDIQLTGCKIELIDLGGMTEYVLYTGYITKQEFDETEMVVTYEDVSALRETYIGKRGVDVDSCIPIIFGDVEKVRLTASVSDIQPVECIGDDLTNYGKIILQVDKIKPTPGFPPGYIIAVNLSEVEFNFSNIDDFVALLNTYDNLYVKCIHGNGKNICKKVDSVGYIIPSPIDSDPNGIFYINLTEALSFDGTNYDFKDKTGAAEAISYLQFFRFNLEFSSDDFQSTGFVGNDLYTHVDSGYTQIQNAGVLNIDTNKVVISSGTIEDFKKVSGFMFLTPTSIVADTATLGAPTDYNGLDDDNLFFYNYTKTGSDLTTFFSKTTVSNSPVSIVDANTTDTGSLTTCSDRLTTTVKSLDIEYQHSSGEGDSIIFGHLFKLTFQKPSFDIENAFPLLCCYFGITDVSSLPLKYKYIICNEKYKPFINAENGIATFTEADTYLDFGLNNFDSNWLDFSGLPFYSTNEINFFEKNLKITGAYNSLGGYNLVTFDYNKYLKYVQNDTFDIYLLVNYQRQTTPAITTLSHKIDMYQFGLCVPIADINTETGIFAHWYGRQFGTTQFGTGATNIMYDPYDLMNHIVRLQDYSREGYSFTYATDDYATVLDNSTSWGGLQSAYYGNNGQFSYQINKYEDSSSTKMLNDLCQNSWSILSLDRLGRYKLFFMHGFFNPSIIRTEINLTNIIDGSLGNIKDRNTNDIFCEPIINFAWDEGSQKYTKYIRVTNTDKAVYDPAYIETNAVLSDPEGLWNAGRMLYVYYGIKNTPPTQLTNSKLFSADESGFMYLDSWLKWQGADTTVKERREISFAVPYEFAVENDIDIGTPINLSVPQYEALGDLLGVITKVNYQVQIKDPKVTCTAFVEVVPVSEVGNIIETGDNDDNIIEQGDNDDNIIEQGV